MVDWSTVAFMFPGQASQVVGMGKDIADKYPSARQTFEQADDFLGRPGEDDDIGNLLLDDVAVALVDQEFVGVVDRVLRADDRDQVGQDPRGERL